VALGLLEGSGQLHLRRDTEEEGNGVSGQVLLQVGDELGKVNVLDVAVHGDDRGARSAAVLVVGDEDSVHVGLKNAREGAQDLADLGRGAVLSLPAEGVSDAVNEADESLGINREEIASHEVLVPFDKGVADDLLLGGLGVLITGKGGRRVRVDDREEELSGLSDGAVLAESIRSSDNLVVLNVIPREAVLHDLATQPALATARALSILGAAVVDQGHVALGGSVELANLGDVEAGLELVPDLGTESVSNGDAHLVLLVKGRRGSGEEVAAELADVLHDGDVVLLAVLEELLGAELLAEDNGAAAVHHHTHSETSSGTVEQRENSVDDIRLLNAEGAAHEGAEREHLLVEDERRLGESSGTAGVNVSKHISHTDTGDHRGRGTLRLGLGDERVSARAESHGALLAEELDVGNLLVESRVHMLDRLGEFSPKENHLASRNLDAVDESLLLDGRVDHGNLDSDLGHAQPGDDELRAVLHKESDSVSSLQSLAQQEVRDLVALTLDVLEGKVANAVQLPKS